LLWLHTLGFHTATGCSNSFLHSRHNQLMLGNYKYYVRFRIRYLGGFIGLPPNCA
jgi:hypothetical protein